MIDYQKWLETPDVVRAALVQVQVDINGSIVTKYLSTHMVTVDSITYLPIISSDITIDESISLDYSASISFGDIEIINSSGEYDAWLDYVWVNKSIKIYVGTPATIDSTSTISDYELIFDGIVSGIDAKDRNHLNLKIRDKLEKLNTSVSETLLGNYFHGSIVPESTYINQYRNNLKPICYGEVHNISPLLVDPTMLEYMVNSESVEQIVEVRDNGVPVPFNVSGVPAGSFRLVYSPAGTITCSIQGVARTVNISSSSYALSYTNTASNTILDILKLRAASLDYSELDATSFSSYGSQAVGLYITNRVNTLAICQEIAKSCGLVVSVTRLGKVRLVDISIPTSATKLITESDMFLNSLTISSITEVSAAVKLGYAKNWTVQDSLITSIPQQHKDMYKTEWLEASSVDLVSKSKYLVSSEPTMETSVLIDKLEADAVAQKKLDIIKQPRKIFSMKCTAKWLSLQVGDAVQVQASRFGLSSGRLGLVISTKPNWIKGYINVEVLV